MRRRGRDRSGERLIRVAIAENPLTAELIRDTLAAAGIRSMLRNQDAAAITLGGMAGAPWSLEVYVLEADAPAAAALLEGEAPPEALPSPALSPPADDQRPRPRRRWWRRYRS